ncbi:2-amino-4-hydroxy-6-hydroxymethyldihydropteridine diphosphokinase [Bacteriovorax sp. Seq25_V]|uniref:2-amino-4-hydroxy-6- hydroxymethyldihydropteridine diphosphokinase n=1 Tax=Bacteriovorax sp. Seq25_V TaxID=1201288 RepID=UPI00038A4E81|nr:2-amino-4-hydroxy-6-hydroxymethyldihydropteridine diphosphokinase [Bacteriovorax sp. Seq25_V]EQC43200.1 2-amino-4-hydroxy-6-hydroxymethyldihydropteridine diphosphokinase [Bacteriovorax sp. Seq25_V]
MSKLVLGLGSNQGNSREILKDAISSLDKKFGPYSEISKLFQSESFGHIPQPDYLNLCVVYEVNNKSPHDCLQLCQQTELSLGRVRLEKWGPRTIDIDILFFDDIVLEDTDLILPHPHINDRSFVVEPLSQLSIFSNLKLFYHFNDTFTTKSTCIGFL